MTFEEERLTGIGGSDIGIVLGVSPWKTRHRLWEEKTGQRKDKADSPLLRKGRSLESLIADEYVALTGRKVQRRKKLVRHPDYEFLIAHLDREILKDPRGVGTLELKSAMSRVFRKFEHYGLSDSYLAQLQHCVMVAGRSWGSFGVLDADLWRMIYFDVEPDPELQKIIIQEASEFWECVQKGTPPADDPREEVKLPRADSAIAAMTSEEWAQAILQLKEAREMKTDAVDIEDVAKEKVQALMGDNEICEGAGARVYWTTQKGKKTIDSGKLEEKYPKAYKACLKTGRPSRVFKPFFISEEE